MYYFVQQSKPGMFFNPILNCNHKNCVIEVATVFPLLNHAAPFSDTVLILANLCGLHISMRTDNCTLCKVHIRYTAEIVKAVFT